MFIVFNKQKIYSYLVALSTVVVLFIFGFAVTDRAEEVLQTSSNIQETNIVTNQIENVLQNNTINMQ